MFNLILWHTLCTLKLPKSIILYGLIGRSMRELRSASSSPYPSLIEYAIKKLFYIGIKVRLSPILLKVNLIFILKGIIRTWIYGFQHLQTILTRDNLLENLSFNPLEDRPHSMMCGFSLAQYTQLCRLIESLSLNMALCDLTIESWKSFLSSNLCFNHPQNCKRRTVNVLLCFYSAFWIITEKKTEFLSHLVAEKYRSK